MITFDATLLTSYYNAKIGLNTASSSDPSAASSGPSGPNKTTSPTGSANAPRAPWNSGSGMSSEDDLVSQVLRGHRFINTNAVTSNVVGASPDYGKLFTLYQGLSALEGLATKAQETNISANVLADVKRRFSAGMSEVKAFVGDTKYDHVALTEGTLTQELKTSVGVPRTNSTYTADSIATGSVSDPVKAFEGDVKFSMSVKKIGTATPFKVDIDLSEMDPATTRSMSNVVSFINSKLKEQGLSTKFAINRTAAVPTTTMVNGKPVTISKGQESFGLQIKGVSYEALTFSAPSTADSVYVVQSMGDKDKKIVSATTKKTDDAATTDPTKPKVTSQLLKFQTDENATGDPLAAPISKVGDAYWIQGESQQTQLPDTIANVRQTVAGPDGSVYVLADVNGTISNQDIKGTQDVALMKYDSAGNLMFTRTLGASDSASGYTMAVASDGKIAIAGSVTGAMDVSRTTTTTIGTGTNAIKSTSTVNESVNGTDGSTTDSFVTLYDSTGVEQWTQRRGGTGADEATALAFGGDGTVYVGGRTQSAMPGGGGEKGGWDAYVMGVGADGKVRFTNQMGTAQTDTVTGLVVDGNTLYTSGIEDSNAVVKTLNLASTTSTDAKGVTTTKYTATQTGSRDLGGIGGGSISGMALYNGKLYLGGSAGSDKLLKDTASVTHDYTGGYDAYAMSIDANLGNTAADTIAFYGGAGVEKDAKVQFANGKAWISGNTTGDIDGTTNASGGTAKAKDAYLARLNIDTGTVEYQTRYTGKDNLVQPAGIAISSGSSSVLDRLGLPLGTLQYKDSDTIVAGTSVRTGDQFYMVDPSSGVRKTITIDAGETMDSLAKKIIRGSGYKLQVDVTKVVGKPLSHLDIKPTNSASKMEFVAGPAGRDALSALGLDAGLVSSDASKIMDASSSGYLASQKPMGLNFDSSLNLSSETSIKSAVDSLKATIKNVQKVYNYLKYGDPQATDAKKTHSSGPVPQYMTDKIANYQAALARLTGGA